MEPWNVDRVMVALTPEEAQLLKAAPALLEALEDVLENCIVFTDEEEEEVIKARKAIALAKGK